MSQETKGFLCVATKNQNFYTYAINLIESIKDFYPDAKCCLVCDEQFVDDRVDIVDDLIFTEGHAMGHYRATLWGMAKTTYDITMYVDADMECEHEDIAKVWDELGDNDMVFHELTKERSKYYSVLKFNVDGKEERYTYCGGVCLYRSSDPKVIEFMDEWFELFHLQKDKHWMPKGFDPDVWQKDLKHFDQTTLWWLLNKEDKWKDIKCGVFYDDIRWNYFTQYGYEGLKSIDGKPPVLRHYSGSLKKDEIIV